MPCRKARASAAAIAGRPAARLIPRISLVRRSAASAWAVRSQPWGQAVIDAAGRDHPADRPPGPVGAVAADPHRRGRAGGQALEQVDQHGVDRPGIPAGVLMQRPELERDAEEAVGHAAGRPACSTRCARSCRPGRPGRPARRAGPAARVRAPPDDRARRRSTRGMVAHLRARRTMDHTPVRARPSHFRDRWKPQRSSIWS